jgi:RimJ/RimL family protein N-acetyltransferase
MTPIKIREPQLEDQSAFIAAMKNSESLHFPWVNAPNTPEAFESYLARSQDPRHKSFLVLSEEGDIAGVFNLNEIVRGAFQSAYLGFYAVQGYAGKGVMSAGLKQVLARAFHEMGLHRLEANIQPDNSRSINLVTNNGFKKEGFSPRYLKINGQWRDHERWAMTYEDFQNIYIKM